MRERMGQGQGAMETGADAGEAGGGVERQRGGGHERRRMREGVRMTYGSAAPSVMRPRTGASDIYVCKREHGGPGGCRGEVGVGVCAGG